RQHWIVALGFHVLQRGHALEQERDEALGSALIVDKRFAVAPPQVPVELRNVEEVEEAEQKCRDEPGEGIARSAGVATDPEQIAKVVRVHRYSEEPSGEELPLVLSAALEASALVLRVGVDERADHEKADAQHFDRAEVHGLWLREQGEPKKVERKRDGDRERLLPRDAPLHEDEHRPEEPSEDNEVEGEERQIAREARFIAERTKAAEQRAEQHEI